MTTDDSSTWVGRRVPRKEDDRALRGLTRYVADLQPVGTVHLHFVRSYVAHGRIRSLDVDEAASVPGVVGVYTAADIPLEMHNAPGPRQPVLASHEVTYVGQPVAVVAAESRYTAEDAAELVLVDYDQLPAVTSVDDALEGSVLVHDGTEDNVVLDNQSWPHDLDSTLASASIVIEAEFRTQRQAAMPVEGRGVLALPEVGSDGLVVYSSTQMPHLLRDSLADHLNIAHSHLRVIAPDIGGAFGVKLAIYPEELVTAALARKLQRPVSWISDRGEAFTSDFQSRGGRYRAQAAFDEAGNWLALGVEILSPAGAYFAIPWSGALVETFIGSLSLPGPYRVGAYGYRCHGVLTNTTPTCSYRATGGPAATWITETLLDRAAEELGMDRAEIRRRNMIQPTDIPWITPYGVELDAASHAECFEKALDAIDYRTWDDYRREAAHEGRVVGLGLAPYVAPTAAGVAGPEPSVAIPYESTTIRIEPSGHVTVLAGVTTQGQGLQTTLAQVVADELGVDIDSVDVRAGDTAMSPYSGGTHGSRAAVLGGAAAQVAAAAVARKLRDIAAHLQGTSPDQIVLRDGGAQVKGAPETAITLKELAVRAHQQAQSLPEGMEPGLEVTRRYMSRRPFTMANGCHAAVVELEPVTGAFQILRYVVVQEGGVIINPTVVEGQVRGGVAQGVGSTFLEEMSYGDDGTPTTGNLADYLLPAVTDVPEHIEIIHVETPSEHPGGMRGIGEAGLHASVAALAAAVENAVSPAGHHVTTLPITPQKIAAMVEDVRQSATRQKDAP